MRLPRSHYRGVVHLSNGKWGAQVCKNKQHIWLGSFCTEEEAAETYDLAAQALHGWWAKTNFKPLSPSDSESWAQLLSLRSRPTTEVINIIQTRANEFQRMRRYSACGQLVMPADHAMRRSTTHHELLLTRVMSLSDIGPQARLQIPREDAGNRYPFGVRRGSIQFDDERGKLWSFRYTVWRGCHTLNGGWAYFVKKKRIKQGDVISFWRVTDELGAVRLLIHRDTSRPADVAVAPSTVVLQPQPNNFVRLFGVNIPIQPVYRD